MPNSTSRLSGCTAARPTFSRTDAVVVAMLKMVSWAREKTSATCSTPAASWGRSRPKTEVGSEPTAGPGQRLDVDVDIADADRGQRACRHPTPPGDSAGLSMSLPEMCAGRRRVYDQWPNCVGVEMAALIEGSASILSAAHSCAGGLEFPWLRSGRGRMPAGTLLPVRIGDVDVYVETLPPAPAVGSEPTSVLGRERPQDAAGVEQVADVFSRAQETILSIATTTASVLEKVAGPPCTPRASRWSSASLLRRGPHRGRQGHRRGPA